MTLTDEPDAIQATVATLLAESRAQHLQKRHRTGKTDKSGLITSRPNYPQAEQHIANALRLRLEAEALDPQFTDPAWADDIVANKGVSHQALVDFYPTYLTIP